MDTNVMFAICIRIHFYQVTKYGAALFLCQGLQIWVV